MRDILSREGEGGQCWEWGSRGFGGAEGLGGGVGTQVGVCGRIGVSGRVCKASTPHAETRLILGLMVDCVQSTCAQS